MTSTLLAPPAAAPVPAAAAPARRRTLEIDVRDTPDVLLRVLSTLRRRGCDVSHVDYRAADRHRPGRLVVAYAPPARCGRQVPAWVANLVDVVAVREAA